jgi:hypothetical protein
VKHGLKAGKGIRNHEHFNIVKKRQGNTTINSDPSSRLEAFTDVDISMAGGVNLLSAVGA